MTDDPIRALHNKIQATKGQSPHNPKPNRPDGGNIDPKGGLRAGAELVGGLLGGMIFGALIDAMLDTRPYGILAGIIIGLAAGFYGVYRMTRGK
jgi:ATP synthase protein I